jgi:hypothetical protein
MSSWLTITSALGLLAVGVSAQPKPRPNIPIELWSPVATFSILGYDPATGEIGGAVQSRVFSVGNGVLWAEAGTGVAATQAIVDVSYGPQAISLLRLGYAPEKIVKMIHESDPDPDPARWRKEGRQFAVMNAKGEYAAFTGPKATVWAGNKGGKFCTAQGNILAGEGVVNGIMPYDFASLNAFLLSQRSWTIRYRAITVPVRSAPRLQCTKTVLLALCRARHRRWISLAHRN